MVVGRQDRPREPEQGIAVVGQSHITRVARDEVAPGGRFKLSDVLAHGRLAQSEQLGGMRKAQGLCHSHEGLEQHGIEHDASY